MELPPVNHPKQNKKQLALVLILVLVLVASLLGVGIVMRQRSLSIQNRAATPAQDISQCTPQYATCQWEPGVIPADQIDENNLPYDVEKTTKDGKTVYRMKGLSYSYTIKDLTDSSKAPITGTTSDTKITYTPIMGHQYECSVKPVHNKCGAGPETRTVNACGFTGCGNTCTSDSQCPQSPAHTCYQGKCALSACLEEGASCSPNKCDVITPTVTTTPNPSVTVTATPTVTPTGVPQCGAACGANGLCPADNSCVDNICVLTACINGSTCSTDRCTVNEPTETPTPTLTPTATPTVNPVCGGPCTGQSDCPNEHSCVNNTCILTKCLNGEPCTSNQCQALEPTATATPQPTSTPVVIVQNNNQEQSQTQSQTVIVTTTQTTVVAQAQPTAAPGQPTAEPTIPSAGTPAGVYFMIASSVLLASLLLVF